MPALKVVEKKVNMKQYLDETEYATKNLFQLIWDEEKKFRAVYQEYEKVKDRLEELEEQAATDDIDPNKDSLSLIVRKAIHRKSLKWARNNLKDYGIYVMEKKLAVEAKRSSIAFLSGAVLQIAKQGLSIVHGKPEKWPSGRVVCGVPLSQIIRYARNQAMHYEEGLHEEEKKCFETLNAHLSEDQKLDITQNMATRILELLGWIEYETYKMDMLSQFEKKEEKKEQNIYA